MGRGFENLAILSVSRLILIQPNILLGVRINPGPSTLSPGSNISRTRNNFNAFSEKIYVYCTQCTQLSQQADDGGVKFESFLQSSPSKRWRQMRVVSTEFTEQTILASNTSRFYRVQPITRQDCTGCRKTRPGWLPLVTVSCALFQHDRMHTPHPVCESISPTKS